MKRIALVTAAMIALFISVPLVGWWLLANDSQEGSITSQPEAERASEVPKPDLSLPPVHEAAPDSLRNVRDPIKALDPDAYWSKPSYEVIKRPDGTYEYRIDGITRGTYVPEKGVRFEGSWPEAREDSTEMSYNPELRRMGHRIGSDGQPKRIAGDGEIPSTWETLRAAQGFGR